MNPELLSRQAAEQSYLVSHYEVPQLMSLFHYHVEVEIVAIVKSEGTKFIGDSITDFKPGEIIVIGQNLPHKWLNETRYYETSEKNQAEAITIHLSSRLIETLCSDLPENTGISQLLKSSAKGIQYDALKSTFQKILAFKHSTGFKQYLELLDILNDLGLAKTGKALSSDGYLTKAEGLRKGRMFSLQKHIINHFDQELKLEELAKMVHMNASSLSRFFTKYQGISLSQYISQVRVGYACKLLLDDRKTVSQVCFESGFNNVSNFNRQFKKLRGISPSDFRKKYHQAFE